MQALFLHLLQLLFFHFTPILKFFRVVRGALRSNFFSFYPVGFHLLWKGNMYVRVKYVFRLVKPGVPLSAIKYLGLGNNRGSKSNYSCRLNTGFSWEQILPTTYTQAKMSGKRNENGLGEGRGVWIVLFSKVTPFERSIPE